MPDTIPIAAYSVTSEDPPALKKGSVRPITGVSPRHMPIFSNVWNISIDARPVQTSRPMLLFDLIPT